MIEVLTGALVLGLALPHILPLSTSSPGIAATIWLSTLALRALTVVFLALYLVVFFPNTEVFNAITHWCWHTVLPLLATHLGLDGHSIGDAAVIVPPFVLAFSVVSVGVGVFRAARAVHAMLLRSSIGQGPRDSLIVGGAEVLLAAAGIARPRVLVSAGALTALDDDELAAGLDHERAHIVRKHRFVLVFAEMLRAFARFLPGTRSTSAELRFHLERDADRWAIARSHDPRALASAICKAATSRAPAAPGLALLSGHGHATRRVDELMEPTSRRPGRLVTGCLAAVATVMVCFTLTVAVSLPAVALAGVQQSKANELRHCQS